MQEPRLKYEDLPDWMRPRQRLPDYVLACILILCSILVLPWILESGLPAASQEWVFRIEAVADNLQNGEIYPRWSPHYHLGYGSPLFNYLAPAPHYLGGLHHLLAQGSPYVSFKVLMIVSTFLAGVGMFLAVKQRWGTLAGSIAALVYLMSPPLLFTVPYVQADAALMLAAGVFPCTLWAAERVLHGGDGREIGVLALLTALLITSSTLMGAIFLGILMCWLVCLFPLEPTSRKAMLGVWLGIGLSAFFWMPALLEQDAVRWIPWDNSLRPLTLTELIRFPQWQHIGVAHPQPAGELGQAVYGLALIGILVMGVELFRWQKRLLPALPFVFTGLLLLYIAVALPSHWLDRTSKFPSLSRLDLLVPLAACCAITAGQCGRAVEEYVKHWPIKFMIMGLLLILIIGASYPLLNPPPFTPYNDTNIREAHLQAELQGVISGSFMNGQLLPVGVAHMPAPSLTLLDSYERGSIDKIDRLNRLPRANLIVLSHGPTHDMFGINVTEDNPLEILTFYFPGWHATFRNQPVPIQSADQTGFIEVLLAEGSGTLNVELASTPPRTAANFLTIFCFMVIGALALWWRSALPLRELEPHKLDTALSLSFFVAAIAVILVGRSTMPTETFQSNMIPVPIALEGGVDLLGYQMETLGDNANLTLYWQPALPDLENYHVRLEVVEAASQQVIQVIERRQPSSTWQLGQPLQDVYWLRLPIGDYQVRLQMLQCPDTLCETPTALRAFEPRGQLIGDQVILPAQIKIR